MTAPHVVVAITGASGATYGLRLARELAAAGVGLSLVISRAGFLVLREECGISWCGDSVEIREQMRRYLFDGVSLSHVGAAPPGRIDYYAEDDFMAPVASGSAAATAMVICPCTMGTLARIASGHSGNLIERAADVMLKERRPLVLVPRETPLNEIHLENMLKLARLGVRIVPAMPAFYHQPQNIDDMVSFVVGRVLDSLEINHNLYRAWGDPPSEGSRGR